MLISKDKTMFSIGWTIHGAFPKGSDLGTIGILDSRDTSRAYPAMSNVVPMMM